MIALGAIKPFPGHDLVIHVSTRVGKGLKVGKERGQMLFVAVVGFPPIFNVVEAPKAFTVVEIVLKTSKLIEPKIEVSIVGVVENTILVEAVPVVPVALVK